MSRYMQFLGGGDGYGSYEQRPAWEKESYDASKALMEAADELARQQANGADIALLKRINPALADQLMRYAAEQIGYRGAHSNDPDEHVLHVDDRYVKGENAEDIEDHEGLTAGLEGFEVDMMDELEAWALSEGHESAEAFAREAPERFAEAMRTSARILGYGR